MKIKKNEHMIKEVCPGSTAQEMEIEPGDILLSINHEATEDVFDYRYLVKNEHIEVVTRKPDGEEWLLEIDKEHDDNPGVEFENDLMSDYRPCSNKCIFCFIDQVPSGMQETLYFKDDDSRLPSLQGNYIASINMKERDIERIIRMQLAPINISVRTISPQLRCKMLNDRFAGDKPKYLQILRGDHMRMNGQMVCCENVNDRAELERTIRNLSRYPPSLRSVSAVPAGTTKFREGLFPIELYAKEEAGAVVDVVESRQQELYKQYGFYFIHASDEWYIITGRDFPEEERHDGYIRLENSVGMMRMFINEFNEALEDAINKREYEELARAVSRTLTIVTGKLTHPTIRGFAGKPMDAFLHLMVYVYAIRNDFFGETIMVSGLVTEQNLIGQSREWQVAGEDLGEVPQTLSNMLRVDERVFLDDLTVRNVERELGIKVVAVESGDREFIDAILDPEYRMERRNDNLVHIQAYDRKQDITLNYNCPQNLQIIPSFCFVLRLLQSEDMGSRRSWPRLIEGREQAYTKILLLFNHRTVLSLEVFPPKRTAPVDTIYNTLDELKGITPDFISVAYGAGGSENSQIMLKIASAIKYEYGTESVAHIPYLNLTRDDVLLILEQLKGQKIENILALWGDRTVDREPVGDFRYAADLVEFIKNHGGFSIIGVCYPEDHQESGGLVRDMEHLKDKVDVGVSQPITQLFSDNKYLYRFREWIDLVGIRVPVEARIMPVVNKKQIERMVSLCDVKLSKKFISTMEWYGNNPIAMRDAGIAYAVDQTMDLAAGGVDGIHLYTMNNPHTANRIYESIFRLMVSQGRFCPKTDC